MDTNRYLQNQNKNQGNDSNMLHQLLLLSLLGGRKGAPSQLPHDYIDSLLYKMEGRHSNKQKIDSMLEMMKQKKFNLPEASNRLMDSGMFGKLLEDRFPLPEESERMRGSKLGGKMLNPLFEKMQSLDLFDRMMNNLSNMID
jgi:hypothetical protein